MSAVAQPVAAEIKADIEGEIIAPLTQKPSAVYVAICGLLGIILLWALVAWGWQILHGLGVTGLNTPVFWGVYIVNFVFFIGISHAGTLISSILRLTNTWWRRPFTRIAEAITVFSLPFGALCPIVDVGRPERVTIGLYLFKFPHFTSAILWDIICITTYLTTSCLYFYLALVPDIAVCRDRLPDKPAWRKRLYQILALGWTGTEKQHRVLDRLMFGMSCFLFALVVSVHTNVSFVFGMTTKPGWGSTIISPFFVLGAIYSGVATVIIFAALFRKIFRLEAYLTEKHFDACAKFLLALCCFWLYAMIIEHLFAFYHKKTAELSLLEIKLFGKYAWLFWTMFIMCFPIPFIFLAIPKLRTIRNLVIVSIIINIGMWLERYVIIVPSASFPYLSWGLGDYLPSWVEVSITAGWLAGFTLLMLVFFRFFPSLTIWEVKEELQPTNHA